MKNTVFLIIISVWSDIPGLIQMEVSPMNYHSHAAHFRLQRQFKVDASHWITAHGGTTYSTHSPVAQFHLFLGSLFISLPPVIIKSTELILLIFGSSDSSTL